MTRSGLRMERAFHFLGVVRECAELGAPPSATPTSSKFFKVCNFGKVCRIIDGVVECTASIRLIRDNVVVHEGKLCSSSALLTGRCSLQENPDLLIVIFPMVWTLRLGFDKANKLEQVR